MDQHLIHHDKGSEARNGTQSLEPINMEFYFMVAALILVVIIQASCIIKMSGRNSSLKKVKTRPMVLQCQATFSTRL